MRHNLFLLLIFLTAHSVILTHFSHVTFNAAHKYLGFTTEVLRTEKMINDIACHPLPALFYKGGRLQYLWQQFNGTDHSETDGNYFSYSHFAKSPVSMSSKTLAVLLSTVWSNFLFVIPSSLNRLVSSLPVVFGTNSSKRNETCDVAELDLGFSTEHKIVPFWCAVLEAL